MASAATRAAWQRVLGLQAKTSSRFAPPMRFTPLHVAAEPAATRLTPQKSPAAGPADPLYGCTCLADAGAVLAPARESDFSKAMPPDLPVRGNIRKWWEFEFLAGSAAACDCLDRGRRGIGLGCGREELIAYFASRCGHVLATDLYSRRSHWSCARIRGTADLIAGMPIPIEPGRVDVLRRDMRHLPAADASMDFAWSCSSIEHVGGLRGWLEVLRELARVLRPGGVALLTSEFCLQDPPYLLPGVTAVDADLFARLLASMEAFEVLGASDLTFDWTHPRNAPGPRRYEFPDDAPRDGAPAQERRVAYYVGITALAPVGFVLRRRQGAVPSWAELDIPDVIRDYSDVVARPHDSRLAIDRLRPYLDAGPGNVSLPFYFNIARQLLEAVAWRYSPASSQAQAVIEQRLLPFLPQGDLHDADDFDLAARCLESSGRHELAARIMRLCALSPSTCLDHAIELSARHYLMQRRCRREDDGVDLLRRVCEDMTAHGVPAGVVRASLLAAARNLAIRPRALRRIFPPQSLFDPARQGG